MQGKAIIHYSSFNNIAEYEKEVNKQALSVFGDQLKLFGITPEDADDIKNQNYYKIQRGSMEYPDHIHHVYTCMGIRLVEVKWDKLTAVIFTPYADPNYGQTVINIQHIKQRPKNNQDNEL